MRTRLPVTLAFVALVLVPLAAIQPAVTPAPAAGRGAIDALFAQAIARGDVPGVVAMATDRERVIYSGAFGQAEGDAHRPMTVDAIFRIASMTKPITSVALLQLVDQGKIGLDDPVAKYLAPFARVSVLSSFDAATGNYTVKPAGRAITVRQLLTHTSGLGYGFTSPIVRDFKPRNGDQFEVGPLMFEPGEQWLYGTSTDWVGRLVETVSGESLDTYFQRHITGPLGMSDTAFNLPADKQPRLVNNWRRDAAGFTEQRRQPPQTVTQFNGGGGLSSTAPDYIRFVRMVLDDGQDRGAGPAAPRLLTAATVAEMSRNHIGTVSVRALASAQPATSADFTFVADGQDKWGLGFLLSMAPKPGLRSPGSLSWGGINNTYFWIDRTKGIGGVILMQFLPFADPKALALAEAFERAVYASH